MSSRPSLCLACHYILTAALPGSDTVTSCLDYRNSSLVSSLPVPLPIHSANHGLINSFKAQYSVLVSSVPSAYRIQFRRLSLALKALCSLTSPLVYSLLSEFFSMKLIPTLIG